MSRITVFGGAHAFLSNFFTEPDGTTVEHDFQAAKTDDLEWKVRILSATTPGKAKRLGRQAPLRPEWESVKVSEMRSLVLRKFWDHWDAPARLSDLLVDTGDSEIVEGNHWHDNFWGDCRCQECAKTVGQNHLGLILMDVRALIVGSK